MTYKRPGSAVPDYVDVYCCANIDCDKRLRTAPAGSAPLKHCGITAKKFATVTRRRWERICYESNISIKAVIARQRADAIRRERAA